MRKMKNLVVLFLFVFIITMSLADTKMIEAKSSGFVIKNGTLMKYLGDDENIKIPDKVKVIGEGVFMGYGNITSVTMPDTVTSIEQSAFNGCVSLKTVKFSKKLISIGDSVFTCCGRLKSITLPKTLTSIGVGAFCDCIKLKSVTIQKPSKIKKVGYVAFGNTPWFKSKSSLIINNILVKGTVDKNGKAIIPNTVKSLGEGAFGGNDDLKTVTIPNNIKSIEASTFDYCTNLKKIIIPTTVKSIGKCAFFNCTDLKTIDVPDSVKVINKRAFDFCSATIICTEGSYVHKFAKKNNLKVQIKSLKDNTK